MTTADDDRVCEDAERITAHLEAIRQALRRSSWTEARRHPVPLTPPQVLALQILVDHVRDTGAGLSLTELSRRMGLAHSTASGIVSRLERRGLLHRVAREEDRRFVRIELAEPVTQWLDHNLAAARFGPLTAALRATTAAERAAVVHGLEILQRLLEADPEAS